ncbi:MAG: thioredoxin domain-containing protein [Myxococcales bacterium]|nr:thioredoxin domain-containing protein [Myxococcales bacterium]
MPNRLAQSPSPYLRQHAENPVDWYPWGEEAFARARAEDKPILLSIGYSACHWCHVMAHESFEDAETAAQLNQDFVCIKVDREEHPDVDQLYQQALQLFDEGGGWPLTMFLLPTGEPFFGGTYYPPHDRWGRPSFRRVLSSLLTAYRSEPAKVREHGGKLCEALREVQSQASGVETGAHLPADLIERVGTRLASHIDRREGGFGSAPKFPNPTALGLLLRSFYRSGDLDDVRPGLLTLTKMAQGGIFDHLGGGFARYSTDDKWLVPHFEKMLYDNALLIRLYAQAQVLLTAMEQEVLASRYTRVIDETVGWLTRQMRSPEGGFYAALDADSEGVEGKYYVFTPEEVERLVGAEKAALLTRCYDVIPGGNWKDPHGHGPVGASILHVIDQPHDDEEERLLHEAKATLLRARELRVPPGTDDKVLTSWNALLVSGLATAGQLLGRKDLLDLATATADFLLTALRTPDGQLLRTWKDGQARWPGTLDDHAFLAEALIQLSQATQDGRYLATARELTEAALRELYDPETHSFFVGPVATDGVSLVARPVSLHDSAIPSGVSVMCLNLLRLSTLYPSVRERYLAIAESTLLRQSERAQRSPIGLAGVLHALDLLQHGLTVTILVEPSGTAGDHPLRRAARTTYVPDHFVWVVTEGQPVPEELGELCEGKVCREGQPTAYVCSGPRCSAPITEATQLISLLRGAHVI